MCINKYGDWLHDEYLGINGIDLSQPVSEDSSEDSSENGGNGSENASGNQGDNSGSGFGSGADKNGVSKNGATKAGAGKTGAAKDGTTQNGGEAPDKKDWRNDGAVTPVKDQLKCASCYAFSAAGALEGQFFLKNGILNSLSVQQLVDCSRKYANNGCNTGYMTNAFLYTRKEGILTEDEYPYEAKDNQCRATPNDKKNQKFKTIPKGDEGKLKEAVGNIGPVSVGLDATHDKFQFYSDGVYFNPDCNPERISHAVLAIGYDFDEKTGMDYWIIKNSYGTSWGEGGYGKIARNKNNHCGITNLASYPIL